MTAADARYAAGHGPAAVAAAITCLEVAVADYKRTNATGQWRKHIEECETALAILETWVLCTGADECGAVYHCHPCGADTGCCDLPNPALYHPAPPMPPKRSTDSAGDPS